MSDERTLLIVEDDETLREALVEEFEDAGFHVLQAENGLVGFEVLTHNEVDGIISDVRMPGGDGIELLKRMNATCDSPPVLIFITGYSDLGVVDAYDLGAEAVVKKPFALDELIRAVNWMLTPKKARWQENEATLAPVQVKRDFPTLDAAIDNGDIALGRGGMFIRDFTSATKKAAVGFDFSFGEGEVQTMSGDGVVQWVRAEPNGDLPAGSGVEFKHIKDNCLRDVLDFENDVRPRPYIPKR